MAVDLEKYRKKEPVPGATPIDVNKYRKTAPVAGPTFNVPEPANYRENRIKQFQAEASQSQAEAEKANSFMGMTKAFGKAFIKNIMPSEVGLGKSIGSILYANSKENKNLQDTISQGEDVKVNLLKTIREAEAQGKDTTRLKQAYNEQEKNVADTTRTARDLVQLPSTAKVAGQLGGTALDILTAGTYSKAKTAGMGFGKLSMATPAVKTAATAVGVPELGAIAGQKAAGLFTLKGAGNVAKGAGLGYASDVALGLQGERGAEREGASAFIPGLGTALGATIPAVSETAQTVKNIRNPEPRIAEKRMQGLRDLETKNAKIAAVFDAADRRGIDVRKTLAETNLLNGAIDTDGRISSDKALANFGEFIAPYESRVKDALTAENRSIQLNQLVGDAKSFIDISKLTDRQKVELQQEIAGQFDAFAQFRGKAVPVTALHDTKVALANSNNYLNPGKNIVDKEAARFFKDLVEKNTSSMDVAKYNGELAKYYTVREALEKMDRAVVSGGRMGKYFSSIIGTGIGGMVGGPLGAVAGAEIGSRARGGMMARAFGSDIKTGLTPTTDLLGALKPKATGKAAIPDVVMPKSTQGIPDVTLPSFKKGAIPLITKREIPVRKTMEKLVGVKKPDLKSEFTSTMEKQLKGTGLEGGTDVYKGASFTQKTVDPVTLKADVSDPAMVKEWEKRIKNGERPNVLTRTQDGQVTVADGAHKLQAYKNLGITKVPTINATVKNSGKMPIFSSTLQQKWDAINAKQKSETVPASPARVAEISKEIGSDKSPVSKINTSVFKNPIDGKEQDSMKIPYGWASYTTAQKNTYLKALQDNKLEQRATTKGYDYNAIKSSVDKRIAESTPDKKYTDDNARSIADSVPGAEFIEAPLKGADRTLEKVINETKTGDVSEIKDIARNTIMPTTKEAHAQVVAQMDARKDIYARKPQEGKDFMGYKGMIYNIKSPSGNITETQVVSPEMMFGKMLPEQSKEILGVEKFNEIQKRTGLKPGYGHEIYDKIRKMTPDERESKAGQKLIKESEDYYAQLSSF